MLDNKNKHSKKLGIYCSQKLDKVFLQQLVFEERIEQV